MAIIYAGIVLYNPDISLLKKNIEAIRNQVAKVVLVDNGSDNIAEVQSLINKYENACLISNGDNLGIAKALNQIMERAKCEEAEWVLTLDQDSVCPDGMVQRFQVYTDDNVGMICPRLDIVGWNLEDAKEYPEIEEVNDCITSGALTSVNAWNIIGGFNEDYFIDLVDSEFSIRMRNNHFSIIRMNDVMMTHEVGESVELKIGKHIIRCTKHSPIRCYYMVRNHFMYLAKYKSQLNLKFETKMLVHKVVTSIMVADEKMKTIKMMRKGYSDYKRGITGKYK